MIRVKGYFRKGRKIGARSSLHNFRKRNKLGQFVAKVVAAKVVVVVEEPEKRRRGRPKKDG